MPAPDTDRSLRDEASQSMWAALDQRLPNPAPRYEGLNAAADAADGFSRSRRDGDRRRPDFFRRSRRDDRGS